MQLFKKLPATHTRLRDVVEMSNIWPKKQKICKQINKNQTNGKEITKKIHRNHKIAKKWKCD